eukprot:13428833-Alexandrium_andersonii.AAC.1
MEGGEPLSLNKVLSTTNNVNRVGSGPSLPKAKLGVCTVTLDLSYNGRAKKLAECVQEGDGPGVSGKLGPLC